MNILGKFLVASMLFSAIGCGTPFCGESQIPAVINDEDCVTGYDAYYQWMPYGQDRIVIEKRTSCPKAQFVCKEKENK